MSARRGIPDDAFPVVVAHRGSSSTHPENTLEAFEAALEFGAPVVELDVRLSADGVPVVIHDPDVARTTDGEGFVHELTAEQIRVLNAGTHHHPAAVPTLREALELLSGRAGVAMEIKNLPGEPAYEPDGERVADAALAELDAVGFEGPVLALSFNPRTISAVRSRAPEIATGLLITDAVTPDDGIAHALEAGHDLLLPGSRGLVAATEALVERAHAAGIRLGTWTVDQPERFRMLLGWGVDAIATNDPAMGLDVLAAWRAGS